MYMHARLLITVIVLLLSSGVGNAVTMGYPAGLTIDADSGLIYLLTSAEEENDLETPRWVIRSYQLTASTIRWVRDIDLSFDHALTEMGGIVFDSIYHRIILSLSSQNRLVSVDVVSGQLALLSGPSRGAGPAFGQLGGMVLDPGNERIIVLDHKYHQGRLTRLLTSVDLASGRRAVLSDINTGGGPMIGGHSIAFDASGFQAFVAYGSGIASVDLHTGERRIFSDHTQGVGMGPGLSMSQGIALDTQRYRLLVSSPLSKALLAVTIPTGERSIVSSPAKGEGPTLCWPTSIVAANDAYLDTMIVSDIGARTLVAIDSTSADRQYLSPSNFCDQDPLLASYHNPVVPVYCTLVSFPVRNDKILIRINIAGYASCAVDKWFDNLVNPNKRLILPFLPVLKIALITVLSVQLAFYFSIGLVLVAIDAILRALF